MFPARIKKYTLPKPKYRIYSLRKLKIDDREIYTDFFPKDVAVQACFNAMNWKSQCVTQSQVWSGLATYYLFLQAEKDFLRQHDRIFVVFSCNLATFNYIAKYHVIYFSFQHT